MHHTYITLIVALRVWFLIFVQFGGENLLRASGAICVLNLSNKYLTDDSLPQLMGSAPEPSIILVEVLPSQPSSAGKKSF